MMDHTPTPWAATDSGRMVIREVPGMCDGGDYYSVAVTSRHSLIGVEEAAANAAFIVRAVNSHEALVKALKAVLPHIVNDSPGGCTGKYHETCAHCGAIRSARKALQQAEGK